MDQEAPTTLRVLEPGRTCWRIVPARRAAFLIDGAAYFAALGAALRRAERRIVILGWDFDAGMRLDPEDPASKLSQILPDLVAQKPELHIYILIWDIAPLFGPSRFFASWKSAGWLKHPRVHFRYDGGYPAGGTLHEKVVCVDDVVAFAGGIDLTIERWDTPEHRAEDPRRRDPRGNAYPPLHDVQIALEGPAAAAVAELARERWSRATGEMPDPLEGSGDCWPEGLTPDLMDQPVGIVRTLPGAGGTPRVTEVAALNRAALQAAERSIYIETQYFSNSALADILAAHLERADGPEIVLLIWRKAEGWIERYVMGANRERLLRRLAGADRHGRLRAYLLAAPEDPETEIGLHSKLVMVDDVFVRIGSSNLNHRSEGLDTECDIAIEATNEGTARAIAGLRDRLLAEHLGRRPDEVAAAVRAYGLIGGIEHLHGPQSRLRAYALDEESGPKKPFPGTAVLDPDEPVDLEYLRRHLWEGEWRKP